jgi:6-phosphogluconolactonase/glucosamine-6-phosphate isomerase/deaminase
MRYINSRSGEEGRSALAHRLTQELNHPRRVLWLLSGGSNIVASVDIMASLPTKLTERLSLLVVDERFGAPGHADSNWQQLIKSGLKMKQATALPVLRAGQTFEKALSYYRQLVTKALAAADTVIAQLGIGDDGHIAGILPHSPAAAEQKALVTGYSSQPYQRLTLTFPALMRVQAAYVFAFGDQKRTAIDNLVEENLALVDQPAQILKQLSESYIYSDQLGGKS